jgi:hypothetical protein
LDETGFKRSDQLLGSPARIHHRAKHSNHIEDPRDGPLIECVDVEPAADQISDDIRLEIGEGQDEVGLECEDLVDIR